MKAYDLDGVWKYTAYSVGGQVRSQQQVERMATIILIAEALPGGWDGVWGMVTYGYQGGWWTEETLRAYCRHIVLDTTHASTQQPDFYLWAGGKFRLAANESPRAIDLQQHWRGADLPSLQFGIYRLEGGHLYLCLAWPGDPRPYTFTSEDHIDQSCGELVRWVVAP